MLDLNNFKKENKVSLNSLISKRAELSKNREILKLECQKFQSPFSKSYLQNPDYIKLYEQLNKEHETLVDLSNCIQLYLKYDNVSGNEVIDDRPEINNVLYFPKASKESFNHNKHQLGFVCISNRISKTSINKGVDEFISEDFCIKVEANQNHKYTEDRFRTISYACYDASDFNTVNDFVKSGDRVVHGYRDENNEFFETGYNA